jgi:hypothetical protein
MPLSPQDDSPLARFLMEWLIRRVIVMSLILGVMCAGVVGIVRANAGPDRLAALGFGVCDGGGVLAGDQARDGLA